MFEKLEKGEKIHEVALNLQPSDLKNGVALKILGEKCCEIKGGGQEMVAMMLMLKDFNNDCVY